MDPFKFKGFRDLLKKAGYEFLLVHEFKASLQYSHCQLEGVRTKGTYEARNLLIGIPINGDYNPSLNN